MINIVYLGATLCTIFGMFLMLAEWFGTPTNREEKALKHLLTTQKEKSSSYDNSIDAVAILLAPYLPFTKRQLHRTKQTLESVHLEIDPKRYLTRNIVKSLLLFLVCLLSSLLIKPMLLIAFAIPLLAYISNSQKEAKSMEQYRRSIERELPDFVENCATQLSATRDILRIMKEYSKNTSRQFQKELLITVADMETGSYEQALRHFAGRINSSILNDVIRGLNGVVQGNDELSYFKMLAYDLKQLEINAMKKQAQKSIPKINACTMILLIGILGLLTGVLVIDMVEGAGALF